MTKKKTLADKEKKEGMSQEESQQEMMKVILQLSNFGEAVYQVLLKWEAMNKHLEKIADSLELLTEEEAEEEDED